MTSRAAKFALGHSRIRSGNHGYAGARRRFQRCPQLRKRRNTMSANNQIDNNAACCMKASGIGSNLMYLALGGGIGAAIAFLLAPKPGRELRQDIAEAAVMG